MIIPVRSLTNRSRMQEFGERYRRQKNIFQFSNLIGASRSGKSAFQFLQKMAILPVVIDGQASEACNGSKSESEGLQEAHSARQKVGQACGWQEVEENCKDASREETTEARDQPERRKPTHTRSVVSG
jgi:hypothetical protein